MVVFKLNKLGELEWAYQIGEGNQVRSKTAIETSTGDYIAVMANQVTSRYTDVVKFTANGDIVWAGRIGASSGDDYPQDMVETNDGGVLIASYTFN